MTLTLPNLEYNYSDLEPYIDRKTMEIHHTKHHQTYIDNANTILKDFHDSNIQIEKIIQELEKFPLITQTILRNNVGGYINHNFFWKSLKKHVPLKGEIKQIIEDNFGNIGSFKDRFQQSALSLFGSGWVWLVKQNNQLNIVHTINQDNPLMGENISGTSGIPILGIDLWEHAYYLQYQNRRRDYIDAFWNIINWDEVNSRLQSII
ncbi:superoxide dismutase [Mn] [Candidatus Schneideria nysicola]|uniref:Fe-Mn family superoxide dismutase n=1 Tax=Candidatus Schneideria nysicola TaxID=1081631 RepID=UPI001CAA5F12|nr:Fe-Mn family superoxide dismutase [Candidatus Schneideria nysicola]UAJ65405.1 superoxide dismutase [Mn] [Candidatus Schneideria nysicola]